MSEFRLILGDALEVLPTLRREGIAAVVADPPYGMANRTNSKRYTGGNRALRRGEGRDDWPEVVGDGGPFDPSPWLGFPKVILWGANHYAQRLPPGTTLVWVKKAERLFGTFLSDAEIGWQKGGRGVYCYREQFPPSCRMEEGGGRCLHPNQKPLGLMRWCLSRLSLPAGAVVLDPYMGSGTVGLACLHAGLGYVGVEINPDYFAVAERRLAEAQGPLFAAGGSGGVPRTAEGAGEAATPPGPDAAAPMAPEARAELERLYAEFRRGLAEDGGVWPVYTGDGE